MYQAKYGSEDYSEGEPDVDEEIAEAIAASDAKYPQIVVRLVGEDGNAMAILGRVGKALKRGGLLQHEVDKFYEEAKSGDYDDLLMTCMRWVTVL